MKKGDVVTINSISATYYDGKTKVPSWVRATKWVVSSVSGDRAVIDKSVDGKYSICSAINVKYLTVATSPDTFLECVQKCLDAIQKLPEYKEVMKWL